MMDIAIQRLRRSLPTNARNAISTTKSRLPPMVSVGMGAPLDGDVKSLVEAFAVGRPAPSGEAKIEFQLNLVGAHCRYPREHSS